MLRVPAVLAYLLLAAFPACSRPAAEPSQAAPRRPTAEEMGWLVPGLSSAGNSFILAWNQHDARALAALWHEGGDFVDPNGRAARGRAQIEALFRDELGASRLDFLSGATESSVGRDVRLEDWDVEIAKAPVKLGFASPLRLHLFLVYSRRPPADRTTAVDRPSGRRGRAKSSPGGRRRRLASRPTARASAGSSPAPAPMRSRGTRCSTTCRSTARRSARAAR
jgi:SnoaL-like domain